MSAIALLAGLLVLAYLGGFLVGGHTIRGFGLPSGSEILVLGFVLGPELLGWIDRDAADAFGPVAQAGLAWLAFILGLSFGWVGERRVTAPRILGATGLTVLAGGLIASAVWGALTIAGALDPAERVLAACGTAAATAETNHHAVRWAIERQGARGRLADLLADLSEADDALPLLAIAALFALEPRAGASIALSPFTWFLITIGAGAVLGMVAALLIGREHDPTSAWGILLGTALLGVGLVQQLGLSPLATSAALGVALAVTSPCARELRAMVAPTERPVMLPALLLAGAALDIVWSASLAAALGTALLARLIAKQISAAVVARSFGAGVRRAAPVLGLGLSSAGVLSVAVGLAFDLRFHGLAGDLVLAAAVVATLLGEFVSPASLVHVLKAGGEIAADTPEAA